MAKAWTEKPEYSRLRSELSAIAGNDFHRKVLPILRLIWPGLIFAKSLKLFDCKGIDCLVWPDNEPFPVVVQCKGFEVLEAEIGQSQISQCIESISSFRKSGLTAKTYILVHNRDGRDPSFREPIEAELRTLVDSGQVQTASLWSLQKALTNAFNSLYERCINVTKKQNLSFSTPLRSVKNERTEWEPLQKVPFRTSVLIADKYKLVASKPAQEEVADPVKELLLMREPISILIGEAGFGKSTTVVRLAKIEKDKCLYVPAAMITGSAVNTLDFIRQCVKVENILSESSAEDYAVHEKIAFVVMTQMLKVQRDVPLILIIDGLDESIYFNMRGGIQSLLNLLREIKIPVILTARTEYWLNRKTDFETRFGTISESQPKHHQRIRLIELLPWSDEKIIQLIDLFKTQLTVHDQIKRIDNLRDLVLSGKYVDFYGDIPRRPLFLRFILETVMEQDPHKVGRAKLFEEWAKQKIQRDIDNPTQFGGLRIPVITESKYESLETTLELSFLAMKQAAALMVEEKEGCLELNETCSLDELLASHLRLQKIDDPTGLVLNSLLVPLEGRVGKPRSVRFGHRTYQEYFLALFLRDKADYFERAKIPEAVELWAKAIEMESV